MKRFKTQMYGINKITGSQPSPRNGGKKQFNGKFNVVLLKAKHPRHLPLKFGLRGKNKNSHFTVEKKSGIVKLRKKFDREVYFLS